MKFPDVIYFTQLTKFNNYKVYTAGIDTCYICSNLVEIQIFCLALHTNIHPDLEDIAEYEQT